MTPELARLLEFGHLRKEFKKIHEDNAKKFKENHKPKFNTIEDLKNHLLNPTEKKYRNNLHF